MDELSETLPNGFHDAEVESLRIDYVRREVVIDLAVWVGGLSSDDKGDREAYRPGTLTLSGLLFCCIEPPTPGYPFAASRPIRIDAGSVEDLARPPDLRLPGELPAGSFTSWIFVAEWNAFIYVAATHASLTWRGEVERRGPD